MMRKVLIYVFLFLILATSVFSIPCLDLRIILSDDDISVDYSVFDGELDYTFSDKGDYELSLLGNQGVLFQNYYSFSRIMDNKRIDLEDTKLISDVIPFTKEMKFFELRRDNELLKRIELELCNDNGLCDSKENSLTCNDCNPEGQDNLCISIEDDFCDPDCLEGFDPDCLIEETKETSKLKWLLWIFGFILLAVLTFLYFKIIKKEKSVVKS
ncbi:hypothetical protein KY330_00815 [Candidatus Woesearchaeota archaeon]|nr:hypothetical protein [Candidatus Woesearchaeota archaeon]